MSFLALYPQPMFPVVSQSGAVGSSSASLTVVPGNCYRIAVTGNTHIKLSKGAAAATATDILVTPGSPLYLFAQSWDTISFIQDSAAGTISVVQVQNPV